MTKNNNLPLVSVVVPSYNHEKYVKETIESIINQTYENIELIIIDDGSKDNSVQIIQEMIPACKRRFSRFEFIHRNNKGLSATLNEAANWAQGKYFSAIASDDIMLKNKISLLVNKLENLDDSYAAAFGNAIFINEESKEIYLDKKTLIPTTKEKGYRLFLDYYTNNRGFDYKDEKAFGSYKSLLSGNYIPAMSSLIKLDKIREVGLWTVGNIIEDWEIWLKLSRYYIFAYVDEPVALYRIHKNNTIKKKKYELLRDSIKVLEREKIYAYNKGYKFAYWRNYLKLIIHMQINRLFNKICG